MPFTPINVTNGSTPVNATWGNLVQTQFAQALTSINADLVAAGFVLSGYTAAKDGTVANQLDVAAGRAYLVQSDGNNDLGLVAHSASTQTTSAANSTYYLDLNPDGSWSWATSHSAVANHLTICTVTTDGSGNISGVTDTRPTTIALLPNAANVLSFLGGALLMGTNANGGVLASRQSGAASGIIAQSWNGAAAAIPFSIGGQFAGALAYVDNNGTLHSVAGSGNSGFVWGGVAGTNTPGVLDINPSDAGQKRWVLLYNGGDHALQFFNITDNTDVLDINPGGSIGLPHGGLSAVAGQATAGSFGVPVIVAQAVGVAVTSTTAQTILNWTPNATGLYSVQVYILWRNGSNSTLTAYTHHTDPVTNTQAGIYLASSSLGGAAPVIINGASVVAPGPTMFPCYPQTVYAGTGGPIQVVVQDSTGTPNDVVSVVVTRLA